MANSDVDTPRKLTVADAIIELTADRVVFDPEILDKVIKQEGPRKGGQGVRGAVKTSFPANYEDYSEGRYDEHG